MCGVAWVFCYTDAGRVDDRDDLLRMTRRIRQRGPDDEGAHVDGALGLGHRRLSIVDLTPSGRQPMHTADANFSISGPGGLLTVKPSTKYSSKAIQLAWRLYPRGAIRLLGDRFGLGLLVQAVK